MGDGDIDSTIAYVPAHMYYIVFELLKNSMRAVCEFHSKKAKMPPIRIAIAQGDEDTCIKISYRGGGIERKGLPRLWTYSYTTAGGEDNEQGDRAIMAGFGHGLPLSRLYARYWGGDVQIVSMQNFGTYAFIYLN